MTDDIWSRGIDTGGSSDYDVYRDFYDVDITWSRSSNIDLVEDNVYPNWDVAYTNDGLERLTQAERGVWGGSSITTTVHDEQWTLGQTGNWEHYKLDLDGDGSYAGTDELDDDQTFNVVNELTGRDTDDDSTDDYNPVYDAAGNMTDDDKDYEYIYDAWGRLVEVQNQSQATVAEYTYNGLGYRTGWHYDVDGDGTVEANTAGNTDDPWFQFVYDARWRITATYRASHYGSWTIDSDPKEQFVYNAAGLVGVGGAGGSSYIDSVILRDRDANTDREAAADGTLEERTYYCQNWRADVVALVSDAGQLINSVRYDPYGVPFGIAKTDLDADGDVDSADETLFDTYYTNDTMPFADWDWSGSKSFTDQSAYDSDKAADSGLGRGDQSYAYSHAGGANRKGYAGYEVDPVLTGSEGWESVYHVRHRVLLSQLGRWTRRDPAAMQHSALALQLYNLAVPAHVLVATDWSGLTPECMYGHLYTSKVTRLEYDAPKGVNGCCYDELLDRLVRESRLFVQSIYNSFSSADCQAYCSGQQGMSRGVCNWGAPKVQRHRDHWFEFGKTRRFRCKNADSGLPILCIFRDIEVIVEWRLSVTRGPCRCFP